MPKETRFPDKPILCVSSLRCILVAVGTKAATHAAIKVTAGSIEVCAEMKMLPRALLALGHIFTRTPLQMNKRDSSTAQGSLCIRTSTPPVVAPRN